MKQSVLLEVTVNGQVRQDWVEEDATLLSYLRDCIGLMGTKKGCGAGECGACTVLLNGRPVYSCITLAIQAAGKCVETIEGLKGKDGGLHPIQRAFVEAGAIQCGFCTPGFIMSTKALLDKNHHPCRQEIKEALAGNLCRCTGYVQIIEAVELAAHQLYDQEGE